MTKITKRTIRFASGKMYEVIYFDDGWMIRCSHIKKRMENIKQIERLFSELNIPVIRLI